MAAKRERPRLSLVVRGRAAVVPETTRRRLGILVRRAMRAAGVGTRELTLSLSDDRELRALNRDYAGEDHATDVLSFSQEEGEPSGSRALLGDVIISVETAARQADAGGRKLGAELFHLAVHGLVHLLGYDHATPAEERVMFGYEARLRAAARASGPPASIRRPRR